MSFDRSDYDRLATLFEDPSYAGYRPQVREIPNADGKVDDRKRFLHVAKKYSPPGWAMDILARAHYQACQRAELIGVPAEFYPRIEDEASRV